MNFANSQKAALEISPSKKALHIIEDGIVRHRAFHHIIVMGNSIPACRNKIQPFIAHFQKALDLELSLVIEGIDIDNPAFPKRVAQRSACCS